MKARRTGTSGACRGAWRAALARLLPALAVVSAPTIAHAAPFELAWEAPPNCPSRADIVAATRARLGETDTDETTAPPPELFVRGRVTRQANGFLVTLGLRDVDGKDLGEREVRVETSSCRAVEDPASLVLAMMIAVARPHEVPATPEPPPVSEEPTPSPPPPPPPPLAPAPAPAPPHAVELPPAIPHTPTRWTLSASGLVSLGTLPNVGFGVALRATASVGSRLVVGLEGSAETSASVSAGSGDVGFTAYSASALVGARLLRWRRLELAPAAIARGGVVAIDPTGFPTVDHDIRASALVAVALLARVQLGPHVRLEVLPELGLPLLRDRFQVREGSRLFLVHQPSHVAARLSLGVAWEF